MQHKLDDARNFAAYDPEDIGYGIERLPEQVRLAWHDTHEVRIPKTYASAKKILVVGMGGSALGAHLVEGILFAKSKIPFSTVRDYQLPAWVGPDTLVILSSYSGTTEEVLSAAAEAKQRKAKIIVVATGSELAAWAKRNDYPSYIFTPGDLAKQPRLGIGFSFIGILGLLSNIGIYKVKDEDIRRAIAAMAEVTDICAVDVPTSENPAKQVAEAIAGKQTLIVAAEHLSGNAHILSNQINETGKQFATYFALPELNHHLLEGMSHPATFPETSATLFLNSALYHPRTRKRFTITADIIEDIGLSVVDYVARGKDPLEETMEVLQFSSYVSWYLAILNQENPILIPYVDGLKAKLGKG